MFDDCVELQCVPSSWSVLLNVIIIGIKYDETAFLSIMALKSYTQIKNKLLQLKQL